jgi:inner membrane protein
LDTITHGLIGALGSRTGYHQKFGKIATFSFLLGSIFPDIDVAVTVLGPDFTMRYHRGLTHSIIAAPVFSIMVMFAVVLVLKTREYKKIYPMVLLGMYSHIFFDIITAYGTVLFDPFSTKRYSWNLVFILDPFITIPVLLGLIISIKKPCYAVRTSLLVFVFLALYLLLSYNVKQSAITIINNIAQSYNMSTVKLNVYPRPLAPFRWMGVVETNENFYKVNINSLSSKQPVFQKFAKSDKNAYVEAAKSHRIARLYQWFADFPIARYRKQKQDHIVEFHDLRFRMLSKRKPFILRYVFDDMSNIKEITLGGRRINNI